MKRQESSIPNKNSPLLLYQQSPQTHPRNIGPFTPIQNDFTRTWPGLVVPYRPPALHQLNLQQHTPYLTSQLFSFPNSQPTSSNTMQTNSSRSPSNHSDEDSLGKTSEPEREELEEDTKDDAKKMLKRNPYSIEELLKKPTKITKTASDDKPLRFIQPPCRIVVDEPCNCTLVAHPVSNNDHPCHNIGAIYNKESELLPTNSDESKNSSSF